MMIGADPDQLDALASQMDSDAQTLDQIRGRVGVVLEQLLWQGTDAHEFFEAWAQRFSGMVGSAAVALRGAARALHAEAVQQREASGEDAGFSILEPVGFAISGASVAVGVTELVVKHSDSAMNDLAKVGITADRLEVADPLLAFAGAGVDIANFERQYRANPYSAQTATAGVDMTLGLGGAAVGVVEGAALVGAVALAPEVATGVAVTGLVLGGLELGNDIVSTFDPRFDEQALHVGSVMASEVASGVRDAFSLIRRNPLSWVPAL